MSTSLTVKGQVTIPKRIREYLKLKAGSKVEFKLDENGNVILIPIRRVVATQRRFQALRGTATIKMTTDEIMALTRG